MRSVAGEPVLETLGFAATVARMVLAHTENEERSETFAALSRGLRVLEEQRSAAAARTCAEHFSTVRDRTDSKGTVEVSEALESALVALNALANNNRPADALSAWRRPLVEAESETSVGQGV